MSDSFNSCSKKIVFFFLREKKNDLGLKIIVYCMPNDQKGWVNSNVIYRIMTFTHISRVSGMLLAFNHQVFPIGMCQVLGFRKCIKTLEEPVHESGSSVSFKRWLNPASSIKMTPVNIPPSLNTNSSSFSLEKVTPIHPKGDKAEVIVFFLGKNVSFLW